MRGGYNYSEFFDADGRRIEAGDASPEARLTRLANEMIATGKHGHTRGTERVVTRTYSKRGATRTREVVVVDCACGWSSGGSDCAAEAYLAHINHAREALRKELCAPRADEVEALAKRS